MAAAMALMGDLPRVVPMFVSFFFAVTVKIDSRLAKQLPVH
jgi:hypothetical protein